MSTWFDAGDAGVGHGGLDAGSVAAGVAGPAGVDEERCVGLPCRQQRGLAAFDVDGVDEQVVCRIRLGAGDLWSGSRATQQMRMDRLGKSRRRRCTSGNRRNSHVRKVYTLRGLEAKGCCCAEGRCGVLV